MRHVVLTVAAWWPTWVLFGLVAWGGTIALICQAVSRFTRLQDRKHAALIAAEKDAAADDLGYQQVRSILDGGSTPAAYQDAVLDEMEKEFRQ